MVCSTHHLGPGPSFSRVPLAIRLPDSHRLVRTAGHKLRLRWVEIGRVHSISVPSQRLHFVALFGIVVGGRQPGVFVGVGGGVIKTSIRGISIGCVRVEEREGLYSLLWHTVRLMGERMPVPQQRRQKNELFI